MSKSVKNFVHWMNNTFAVIMYCFLSFEMIDALTHTHWNSTISLSHMTEIPCCLDFSSLPVILNNKHSMRQKIGAGFIKAQYRATIHSNAVCSAATKQHVSWLTTLKKYYTCSNCYIFRGIYKHNQSHSINMIWVALYKYDFLRTKSLKVDTFLYGCIGYDVVDQITLFCFAFSSTFAFSISPPSTLCNSRSLSVLPPFHITLTYLADIMLLRCNLSISVCSM